MLVLVLMAICCGHNPTFTVAIGRLDEPSITEVYVQLFDQIWKDPGKVADVTDLIREHIAAVYQVHIDEELAAGLAEVMNGNDVRCP